MISYQIGTIRYQIKSWKFPAGEVGCQIQAHSAAQKVDEVRIVASIQSSDELMQLFMVTDALRRQFYNARIELWLGYTPYGRQDRVCNDGESLSLAVFASLINAQNYSRVVVLDPHSDVTPALLNKCTVNSLRDIFISMTGERYNQHVFVAPDAGAAKKVGSIAEYFGCDVVYGVKKRNMADGKIVSLDLSGDVEGKRVIVVDDICDAGNTFIKLGEKLKECGVKSMDLFVTHGLFTGDTQKLTNLYNSVYSTNSYHQDREEIVDGVFYFRYF
jgi:ribose-phosphate pyrophosphokinase